MFVCYDVQCCNKHPYSCTFAHSSQLSGGWISGWGILSQAGIKAVWNGDLACPVTFQSGCTFTLQGCATESLLVRFGEETADGSVLSVAVGYSLCVTVGKVIVLAGSIFCGPWVLIQPAGNCVLEDICPGAHTSTCFLPEVCGTCIRQVFL